MVANVITYRGRSAVREVGKVLDFDQETLAGQFGSHLGMERSGKDSSGASFRDAGLICEIRASESFLSFIKWFRISHDTWDNIQVEW